MSVMRSGKKIFFLPSPLQLDEANKCLQVFFKHAPVAMGIVELVDNDTDYGMCQYSNSISKKDTIGWIAYDLT